MKRHLIFLSLLSFLFVVPGSVAQESGKEKRLSKKASRRFMEANYGKSIPLYNELIRLNPNSFDYNFNLGISYFYSSNASDKLKAVPNFEAALKNMKDTVPEIYYYLGQTYQIANRFDEAANYYAILKMYVEKSQSAIKDLEEIDNFVSQCNNAKQLMKAPIPIKIVNMGNKVNSDAADYAPAISSDESLLIFTSKRKGTTGGRIDDDGKYFEDIYISRKNSPTSDWETSSKLDTGDAKLHLFKLLFSSAEKISKSINTRDHDASVSLSPDGKTLYMYRKSDIWKSVNENGTWSNPERLPEIINSPKHHEPSISQSADGNTLFIVSERPGGFGGKDIYKSIKQADGSWGELENIGSNVNTPFDEDAPFIHPDGKTLFFSSQGHNSMGGFDIFKTTFENNTWATPVNIGYPINTAADDIFFVINKKGDHAYYSSIKEDNYGDLDIYIISPQEIPDLTQSIVAYLGADSTEVASFLKIIAVHNQTTSPLLSMPAGKILSSSRNNGTPYAITTKINWAKNASDTNRYITSLETGKQIFSLPSGEKYVLNLQSEGYPAHIAELDIPLKDEEVKYYQEIILEDIKDSQMKIVGRTTTIYTVLLDMDSVMAANPAYSNIPPAEAYAAWLKSNNYSLASGLKVQSFTDLMETTLAINSGTTTDKNGTGTTTTDKATGTTSASGTTTTTDKNGTSTTTTDKATGTTSASGTTTTTDKNGTSTTTTDKATGTTSASGTTTTTDKSGTGTTTTDKASGTTSASGTTTTTTDKSGTGTTTADNTTSDTQVTVRDKVIDKDVLPSPDPKGNVATETMADVPSFGPVLFDFAKSLLREDAIRDLNEVYNYISQNKNIKLEIYGHTDAKGSEQYNLGLSQRRASATKKYFTDKGINASRIKAISKGESQPIAPNENPDKTDNPEGRQLNRRVEFKVIVIK